MTKATSVASPHRILWFAGKRAIVALPSAVGGSAEWMTIEDAIAETGRVTDIRAVKPRQPVGS